MTREHAQIIRLLLLCAAWAAGEVLSIGLGAPGLNTLVAAGFATGAYVLTGDLGRPRLGGDEGRYWRGRHIEEDRPRRDRWN